MSYPCLGASCNSKKQNVLLGTVNHLLNVAITWLPLWLFTLRKSTLTLSPSLCARSVQYGSSYVCKAYSAQRAANGGESWLGGRRAGCARPSEEEAAPLASRDGGCHHLAAHR